MDNAKKKSNSDGLGLVSRSVNIMKSAMSTVFSEKAVGTKSVGIECSVIASIVSIACTCMDPNMKLWQKGLVIAGSLILTGVSIYTGAFIWTAAAYVLPNLASNYFDYLSEKADGEDVKFNFIKAAFWG